MKKSQALYVARMVLQTADESFGSEELFEEEYGVTHAQVVNALPIISAMELLEES